MHTVPQIMDLLRDSILSGPQSESMGYFVVNGKPFSASSLLSIAGIRL